MTISLRACLAGNRHLEHGPDEDVGERSIIRLCITNKHDSGAFITGLCRRCAEGQPLKGARRPSSFDSVARLKVKLESDQGLAILGQ